MEIIEYLRIARSRKWVLLGVPILAAAATSGIILGAPTTYSATATISPAALVGGAAGNQYNGSQAVSQYVAAFQATASGPAVRHAVSSATNIPTSEIADGTNVQQVGASSAMTITYHRHQGQERQCSLDCTHPRDLERDVRVAGRPGPRTGGHRDGRDHQRYRLLADSGSSYEPVACL